MLSPDEIAALARRGGKGPLFEPGQVPSCALDRSAIERLLPHRDPFLFVEAITGVDLARGRIVGRRTVGAGDPVFRGHFPGDPIYPGVLEVETMGQLGLCLLGLVRKGGLEVGPGDRPASARALRIHQAVFLAAVPPESELRILAQVVHRDDSVGVCTGQVWHGERLCAFAILEVYLAGA